jgi:hypothetical protein
MKWLRLAVGLMFLSASAAFAWDPYDTPEDYFAWMQANQTAEPQFIDGDVISYDKAELLQPFMPPAYQDEMFYEGMEIQIRDAGDLTASDVYKAATAKFMGQASLDEDYGIVGYTAGMPFDRTKFRPGSVEDGFKLAWNFNYRWNNQGAEVGESEWVWVRPGSHAEHALMKGSKAQYYQGGGKFERVLAGTYKRIWITNRSDLPDTNYEQHGAWAPGVEYREYQDFHTPFDIAGTAFLIQRYNDPHKADDSWAYIPSLRRVRRISVEVKADSLLGTDITLEDFYCFAGRPLEHTWEYAGTARLLAVARSRNRETIYGGPNGWVPVNDDWALRTMDVVKVVPTWSNHPYSLKIMMIDSQTSQCYYSAVYDKAGKFWKLFQASKIWTEDEHFHAGSNADLALKIPDTPRGTRVSGFQGIVAIDKQNKRGTLIPVRGITYPNNVYKDAKRRLDVNSLTEGR